MTIYLCTFTETRPGFPLTQRALCGHKSETKKEFSFSLDRVTCAQCLRLAGMVVVNKMNRNYQKDGNDEQ